jgi:CubicO group peptidase (beta-lactamase class C family)
MIEEASAADDNFRELDDKIREGMRKHAIPGVAVGVYHQGAQYLKGYGVTNVDHPEPVDENTLFRIGSTTKVFTGTTVMRLVEAGKLDLDATVRTYLPGFTTRDPSVAEQVTLRQVLNHSPGWLGDDFQDFGRGEDAIAKFVASIAELPQLTPLGSTFFYNNAALVLAGHVIETVNGTSYETAVENLLLKPLKLDRTRFFTDQLVGNSITASHKVANGKAVVDSSLWYMPRTLDPTGALISSARDQLAFARFHLGDGKGPDGAPILNRASLEAMRSKPGPGGTLYVELDGMGVALQLRPSAEGVRIVQHGGNYPGQHSGWFFVPDRDFAFVILTNSDGGPKLVNELCADDWVLSKFAGLHNLPAEPRTLSDGALAAYAGEYTVSQIDSGGKTIVINTHLTADRGRLRMLSFGPDGKPEGEPGLLAFYRDDYVLLLDLEGNPLGYRSDFIRDETGRVQWFRSGGRLYRKVS